MTENGKPKYFSLMEQLKADIVSGAICPGEKLPSENELSQKYSLSRHTVRKALGTGWICRSISRKRDILL